MGTGPPGPSPCYGTAFNAYGEYFKTEQDLTKKQEKSSPFFAGVDWILPLPPRKLQEERLRKNTSLHRYLLPKLIQLLSRPWIAVYTVTI